MNLRSAAPPQIDHLYVELLRVADHADRALAVAYGRVHDALGERKGRGRYEGRRYVAGNWPTSDEEAVVLAEALLADGSAPDWKVGHMRRMLEELAAADTTVLDAHAAFAPLDAEWDRRGGWSRFFLVTNNNGHIHNTTACSTCFATTEFSWLPDLSGSTEEDAVNAHGSLLCSVCFPSAPVEWTLGRQAPVVRKHRPQN